MSDTLLTKLRVDADPLCNEAADYIEQLHHEVAELRDRRGCEVVEQKELRQGLLRIASLIQAAVG